MAQTAAAERINPFLVRCNLTPSTRLQDLADPAVRRPELSFRIVTGELLASMGEALARIERGDGAEAALQELRAVLQELAETVARDPGISMAADDVYAAASALSSYESVPPGRADVRRSRLLKEAKARLRDRIASARPSEKARLSGLN